MSKIESRQAIVAVIGLGYVGLSLAVAFAEAGFPVTFASLSASAGLDVDPTRVDAISRGESYVQDILR